MKSILLIFLLSLSGFSNYQTIVKDVPIVTKEGDSVSIEIRAYDVDKKDSVWVDIKETRLEYDHGWYATGKINIKLRKRETYLFRFLTGSRDLDCYKYTYLKIYGGDHKETYINSRDNPI